jgi:signal transduction histidine kinase
LALSIIVPIFALLIGLTLVGSYGFTGIVQTLVEQRDAELVRLYARQIADHWADSVLLLTQVASMNEVRGGDIEAATALLAANTALRQRFDSISITDAQGVVVATVGGELGDSVGQLNFYERTRRLRRPVRSATYEDAHGRRVIAVAVPNYDVWGRFSGCTLGMWHLDGTQLGLPVANIQIGEQGYAYLVDEYGIILYHPSPDLIGLDASGNPVVAALLQGEAGAQTVRLEGRTSVMGYVPISQHRLSNSLLADASWDGWGLLAVERWDTLVAPVEPYLYLMTLLLVLLLAVPLAILALSGRSITGPLESLAAQAERVASGEFDTQVSIESGPSEVRNLEEAFNKMVVQLLKYRTDIQTYLVSILNTQEEERKRIARELHDETAQTLIVLGRRIEVAQELAENQELADQLEALRDMVDDTLQGVRRFTGDLRPPLLEELGLPRTLEILGGRIEREEALNVEVKIVGEPSPLLPEVELGLYRLTQEGLSNVWRHAQANQVEVMLSYMEDAVKLEIVDDGIGFDAPSDPAELLRAGRLGLMGIHERARLLGGKATIRSEQGGGTIVSIEIPLSAIVRPIPGGSGGDSMQSQGEE